MRWFRLGLLCCWHFVVCDWLLAVNCGVWVHYRFLWLVFDCVLWRAICFWVWWFMFAGLLCACICCGLGADCVETYCLVWFSGDACVCMI